MSHVTVHLWRVRPSRIPAAVLRMGLDRLHLRVTPGLRFAKLLGTGDGRTFGPADADPTRWGLLAAWDDADAADAFEGHATPRGWRRIADGEWRADLTCTRARGRWAGRQPFTPDPALAGWDGPVASVTRARLRPRLAATFWRAVPPVVADLDPGSDDAAQPGPDDAAQPGADAAEPGPDAPLLRVGIGEAPVGLQGTFTVWPDADALTAFAYRRPAHREAIARTAELGWYAEELFARFAVRATRGDVGLPGTADVAAHLAATPPVAPTAPTPTGGTPRA